MPPNKRRKDYSEDTLQLALKEIEKGSSLRSASIKYKIPRSTLQNRNSGKTQYQPRPGPKILKINEKDEKILVDWILKTNESGEEIKKSMIAKYAKENFECDGKFSHGWYRGFYRRNPDIEKLIKHTCLQPYYGMDVKLESGYLINKNEEDDIEGSEESNGEEYFLENNDSNFNETDCKTEIKWKDLTFEKNELVNVALCFACAMIIKEPYSSLGIKCTMCLRTYHIICANKQARDMHDMGLFNEDVFNCLVCRTKYIEKT